jgi:hypothetical protein
MDGAASHLYRAIEHATPSQAQEWAKRQQRLKRMVPIVPEPIAIAEPSPCVAKPELVLPPIPDEAIREAADMPILSHNHRGEPRIEHIQREVIKEFPAVTMKDLYSARRLARVVLPRQIAMYLSKTMTVRSLPDIGRRFGGRDHTTVLHAVNKIARLIQTDAELAATVEKLRRTIA